MGSTGSGLDAREDFGMRRHESAEQLDIFIVHGRDLVLAEMAGLGLAVVRIFGNHGDEF